MTPVSRGRTSWIALAAIVVAAALAPLVFTDFFLSVILTKTLWLGIAAASLIFLAAFGGMVSLAQVGIYGIAGMTFANLVAASPAKKKKRTEPDVGQTLDQAKKKRVAEQKGDEDEGTWDDEDE